MQKDSDGEEDEEEEDEEDIGEKLPSLRHLQSSLMNAGPWAPVFSRSHAQLQREMLAWTCEEGTLTGG